ncbi:argininosuccinate synthase [Halobacteriales archaeon QS_8_69_26]|nr:MAG: argininosuccinate synthase [Halobacteriales archaeon QS_8_69_26]
MTHPTHDDEKTVALAFSGGLDTTVCVPLLKEEYGYDEVIGVTVDVGQPEAEMTEAAETADALDIEQVVLDEVDDFAAVCLDAVQANADYQGYPLGTALARPVIAEAILDAAEEYGCSALAHGCTGKGNDQLRFEAVWRASDLDVIAPVRELGLTRDWELEYAAEKGLPVEGGNEGDWSIDANLWSRSVEGSDLEDPGHVPPEDVYEWTDEPGSADPETVTVTFESGVPVAVDGEAMDPAELIAHLNDVAGAHGVGRTDMMEDRMLGLKVRENYEHPAATVLLTAHEALEGLVLTKDERDAKADVDAQWGEKAYEGLLAAPVVDALEAFIETTQATVTGTVTCKLHGGTVRPVARDTDHAAYSESAASFDTETVDGIAQDDATGVAKYHGFQARLATEADGDDESGSDDTGTTGEDEPEGSTTEPAPLTDGGNREE